MRAENRPSRHIVSVYQRLGVEIQVQHRCPCRCRIIGTKTNRRIESSLSSRPPRRVVTERTPTDRRSARDHHASELVVLREVASLPSAALGPSATSTNPQLSERRVPFAPGIRREPKCPRLSRRWRVLKQAKRAPNAARRWPRVRTRRGSSGTRLETVLSHRRPGIGASAHAVSCTLSARNRAARPWDRGRRGIVVYSMACASWVSRIAPSSCHPRRLRAEPTFEALDRCVASSASPSWRNATEKFGASANVRDCAAAARVAQPSHAGVVTRSSPRARHPSRSPRPFKNRSRHIGDLVGSDTDLPGSCLLVTRFAGQSIARHLLQADAHAEDMSNTPSDGTH